MTDYKAMSTQDLLTEGWSKTAPTDPAIRGRILGTLKDRERMAKTEAERAAAWPSELMSAREQEAGLYPDPADPQFAARLYEKREFYEARATLAGVADGSIDPCSSAAASNVFELTPVQRIVSRFLHPSTPYMGMLLYHGVGVGKTCSAVTIAEQYLETAPTTKVIVLVPQALKENFKRTVFDPAKLVWNSGVQGQGQWSINQCTGTSYLERLDLMENPDLKSVTYKVEESRRERYTVTGYQAFSNWIARILRDSIPVGLTDPDMRLVAENEVLRRLFSDHLIIVDEAHNLRDLAAGESDSQSVASGEAAENQGGKALNPYLKRIVLNAEGLRLVFMTATPMYNSAPEIVLLLNYLWMNDFKTDTVTMKHSDIFTKEGALIANGPGQLFIENGARRYVSYMRGENPYTFPLRMRPFGASSNASDLWPEISATKVPISLTGEDKFVLDALPLIFTEPVAGSPVERQLRSATSRGIAVDLESDSGEEGEEGEGGEEEGGEGGEGGEEGGEGEEEPGPVGDAMLTARMQMANISYPNGLYGIAGWDFHFSRQFSSGAGHKLRVFSPKAFEVDSIFAGEGLRSSAPKIHRIVESIKSARGICFAYSGYIKPGALPLAAALERAGFQRRLADGSVSPLLVGVPPVAPICAVCSQIAAGHGPMDNHTFKPACYVLLTSEEEISPNFAGLVRLATTFGDDPDGPLGSNVKVIIGSQVASEGLDLKCVREVHILDSWYHLNRTDQIIGRAIRFCSHTALRAVEGRQKSEKYPDGLPPMSLNNCSIYLHVTLMPATEMGPAFETADMYAYRLAIGKAQMVGAVQRLLKKHAWDCNLEIEAITFAGLPPRAQIDAQGNELDSYSINDVPYTTYCDYQLCTYQCATSIVKDGLHLDESTFGVNDARRLVLAKQSLVRQLFDDQVIVAETVVQEIFSDLPWEIASEALMELLDGRQFHFTRPDGVPGFLVKKAGYLVFQPEGVTDTDIPMTLRYARGFQLQRHFMETALPVWGRAEPRPAPSQRPLFVATDAVAVAGSANVNISEGWLAWRSFVLNGGQGSSGLPKLLKVVQPMWSWLLSRYASLPETKPIALRWWFEKVATFEEQKAALELVAKSEEVDPELKAVWAPDTTRLASTRGYRIFSPKSLMVEYHCASGAATSFSPCASTLVSSFASALGRATVKYPEETGALFGFLVAKKGSIVFKTMDTKVSARGAECGNVSNLPEHHPRLQLLHAAAATDPDLGPLMLPDAKETWNQEGLAERTTGGQYDLHHMMDITQKPLCLYMEFLTRMFDARLLGGRRWFLNTITAANSGLKST